MQQAISSSAPCLRCKSFTSVRLRSDARASFLSSSSSTSSPLPPSILRLYNRQISSSPFLPLMAKAADASGGNLTELDNIADFEAIASSDGYISICGFGSLLSGYFFHLFFFPFYMHTLGKSVIECLRLHVFYYALSI